MCGPRFGRRVIVVFPDHSHLLFGSAEKFVGLDLGPNCFANVINRRQKLSLASKD